MRKVLEANFHQALFFKGIGEIGRTLSSQTDLQGTKTMKVEMETDGHALYLKIERQGKTVEAMVPSANVVGLLLEAKAKPVKE